MTHALTQSALLASFQCLGDKCEDTCCQNWSMLVDERTVSRYQASAPELLQAVEEEGGIHVMKRDPATRYCIKLEGGWCGIHRKHGSEMLGDACHFYPRVTRKNGSQLLMTASPSCPEVVRLMLSLDQPFATQQASTERLPYTVKDYLPQGMGEAVAFSVHQSFLAAALDDSVPPEYALARIANVARSLALLDQATLDGAVPLYLRLADSRIPAPQSQPADAFNVLHALCGLIVASHKPVSPRLKQTIHDMEQALKATLDWQNVHISLSPESASALVAMQEEWQEARGHYDHALRRILAMQLTLNFFPFAGLGADAVERITIIGVRFATIRLALMSAHHLHGLLPQEEVVRIVQSLSRFLDHLGDAKFSLAIYGETGWINEARLLGLLL